ncbi:hypothetical protein BZA77DRAFT_302191 [Pyronema omphalodes]|nr:hypothetical protein BZA77DRAFT_302191 [Pyronema omphalodes]
MMPWCPIIASSLWSVQVGVSDECQPHGFGQHVTDVTRKHNKMVCIYKGIELKQRRHKKNTSFSPVSFFAGHLRLLGLCFVCAIAVVGQSIKHP